MRRSLFAAALALCLLGLAAAQAPPGFDCSQLPNDWGQDQDQNNNNNNNDNEPWQALATAPGQVRLARESPAALGWCGMAGCLRCSRLPAAQFIPRATCGCKPRFVRHACLW